MKEKILAQLVTKYPGVSKKFLGLYADKLALTVTEDTAIEGALAALDNLPISIPDMATEFQKEGDRRVTEAKKNNPTPTPGEPKPNPEPAPTPQPNDPAPKPDDTPQWAKSLMADIAVLKGEKAKTEIQSEVEKACKDIPAILWKKRAMPEKLEDVAAFAEEVKTDFNTWKQEGAAAGFAASTPPAGGSGSANGKPSEKEIKSLVDKL